MGGKKRGAVPVPGMNSWTRRSPPTTETGWTAVEQMGAGSEGASKVWIEKCSVGVLRFPGKRGGKSSCIYGSIAREVPN